LSLSATGGHSSTTSAKAGAGSTGISLAPAVAVTISNVSRTGQVVAGGADIAVSGTVAISGKAAPTASNRVVTTAVGSSSSSGSAAIGVAVALAFVYHDYIATTGRNVN